MTAMASATAGSSQYQPPVARMIAPVTATPAAAAASATVSSRTAATDGSRSPGALILRGDDDDGGDDADGAPGDRDASVAAVLLDTVADAAAAAGVAVTGAIILATGGWYWLDPAVALVIAIIVAYHALALIRKVTARLRTTATGSRS